MHRTVKDFGDSLPIARHSERSSTFLIGKTLTRQPLTLALSCSPPLRSRLAHIFECRRSQNWMTSREEQPNSCSKRIHHLRILGNFENPVIRHTLPGGIGCRDCEMFATKFSKA